MGTGPDHSLFDVYIGGTLWQSYDGYAPTEGERVIHLPADALLEIRNRASKNIQSTGYVIRFKQLDALTVTYDERTIQYTYDALSRLTEADYGDTQYSYGFDLAGNLTNNNGASRTYNAANQLINDGTNSLTYDANGNLTSDGVNSYVWDHANRLLSMGGVSYAYNGDGNRVQQDALRYILDLQPGLAQVIGDSNGSRYIHSPRGIHAVSDDAAWTYPLTDALGSVRGYADENNAVLSNVNYSPIGVPDANITGPAFTGEWRSENETQYHRARHLSPGLGVWLSLDPVEGVVDRPMSLNGYSWVEGNVINMVDPTGMCTWLIGPCAATLATTFVPIVDEAVACGSLVACGILTGSLALLLSQVAEELAETTGMAIAEAERIVAEAFRRHEEPEREPQPDPTRPPVPIPVPAPTPDHEECPTNHPPHSRMAFDTSRGPAGEMDDIMCNIRNYSVPSGPQPYDWWQQLRGRVQPIFASQWMGTTGEFVGRRASEAKNVGTGQMIPAPIGSLLLPRPGNLGDRADIMSLTVHELRHAGQYYSMFSSETVRGQRLVCPIISGRIAEVDAWRNENHWLIGATMKGFNPQRLSSSFVAQQPYNSGVMWSVDDLWNHQYITDYNHELRYGNAFDIPPIFTCPGASNSALSSNLCIDKMVMQHL